MDVNKIEWKENNEKWTAWDKKNQLLGWTHELSSDQWYYCQPQDVAKGWFQDEDKRWYYFIPQQQVINDKVYYKGQLFDGGWMQYKNKWVYCVPKSDSSRGLYRGQALCDGTYIINGKEYLFDKDCYWVENKNTSDNLFNFIKKFEGCYLNAYYCPSGILTIGIGTTNSKWTSKGTITMEEAKQAFNEDIKVFAKGVDSLGLKLKSYERDALISFAYNVGLGALKSSTLLKDIKAGNRNKIETDFLMWNKGSNGVLEGLTKRRKAEAKLFLYGKYE